MANQGNMMAKDGAGRFAGQADLTDMQAAFVNAYLVNGGNATAAARTAEYAAPHVEGYRLIRNPRVMAAIQFEQDRRLVAACAEAERVLRGIIALPAADVTTSRLKVAAANALFKRADQRARQIAAEQSGEDGAAARARARALSIADLERVIAEMKDKEARTIDVTPCDD